VLIIGAGFGGLETARRLARSPVKITLIDKRNYHLFQPLLYQIAIAGLTPSQIAYPVRSIFRNQKNLNFQQGEVELIDFNKRYIKMNGSLIAYDYLIIATGGHTNYFGLDAIREKVHELKNIESAVAARNHLLGMFELASREADQEKRRAMLTFVIAGGGPTGVETAGALAELIRLVLSRDYPQLDLRDVRVLLLEATDHLMGSYPDELRRATFDLLRRKNVEISLSTRLAGYDGNRITLGNGSNISARTLIWTAGVRASELADKLGVDQAGLGRIRVNETLQLPGHPEVYIVGDSAYFEDAHGQPLPMLATVAQQEAATAVENIQRSIRGLAPVSFRYKDPGLLATIGRNAAVARIAGLSFSGFPAWVIWVSLHIYRLIGFRNRLLVLINWAWDYVFYDSQVRLITAE
jgi:NADH dehydrogenase